MTDIETDNQTEPTEAAPEPRVTFTPEQQAKIDEIVRKAQGRAAAETRRELEQANKRVTELESQLSSSGEQLRSVTTERDSERSARLDAERREMQSRKQTFITEQAMALDFVDAQTVASLTEQNLRWNPEKESFDIIGDDGTMRDITPQAFFAEFATRKPFLVRSNARSGNGSEPSARSGLPTGRQVYKVEEIFGKGSNSRLANDLAKKDPKEYQRLKAEAKRRRLV